MSEITPTTSTLVERWIVNTTELPHVTVHPVRWDRESCSLGLYATQKEAWEAAHDHVEDYLRDAYVARRAAVEELDRRIERAERARDDVRRRLRMLTAEDNR